MILELTKCTTGQLFQLEQAKDFTMFDKGSYVAIINKDYCIHVKETIEEIKQQIKKGGVK